MQDFSHHVKCLYDLCSQTFGQLEQDSLEDTKEILLWSRSTHKCKGFLPEQHRTFPTSFREKKFHCFTWSCFQTNQETNGQGWKHNLLGLAKKTTSGLLTTSVIVYSDIKKGRTFMASSSGCNVHKIIVCLHGLYVFLCVEISRSL